jgi:hypothetical protein
MSGDVGRGDTNFKVDDIDEVKSRAEMEWCGGKVRR